VTGQARAWRSRFSAWGWTGGDHAASVDPRVGSAVRELRALDPAPGDVLLVHHSAYAPGIRAVLARPNPVLVLSHNVTPPRWLWGYDAAVAVQCALGRAQLPALAARADVAAGVSAFNARELRDGARVVPILFDRGPFAPAPLAAPPTLLFVGRLAPHKRQDELIRVLALLRRRRVPDARLVLVGEPLNPAYDAALRGLAEQLAPGAVTFLRGLTREQLAGEYRRAGVFVSLSEHEGFCIPLLEAFASGLPVVARPAGGVPEVAGDAALPAGDRDLGVLAELVALALEDAELRAELRRRGEARLAAYAPAKVERAMREAVELTASRA